MTLNPQPTRFRITFDLLRWHGRSLYSTAGSAHPLAPPRSHPPERNRSALRPQTLSPTTRPAPLPSRTPCANPSAELPSRTTTAPPVWPATRERGLHPPLPRGPCLRLLRRFSALDGKALGLETIVLEDLTRPSTSPTRSYRNHTRPSAGAQIDVVILRAGSPPKLTGNLPLESGALSSMAFGVKDASQVHLTRHAHASPGKTQVLRLHLAQKHAKFRSG